MGASGQLGYGNVNAIGDNETPASAGYVDVGGVVTQLIAKGAHTCGLLNTGQIKCWGLNSSNQLGLGNTNTIGDNELPSSVGVLTLSQKAIQVTTGSDFSCALLESKNVQCWGSGSSGVMGNQSIAPVGTSFTSAMYANLANIRIGGEVVQIASGSFHNCALLTTGNVRCWGANTSGQLGYSNTTIIGDNETPATVGIVSLGEKVSQISVGGSTCALLFSQNVLCWGSGNSGRLGTGNYINIGDDELPSSIPTVNFGEKVKKIDVGPTHSCVILISQNVICWGSNSLGGSGYPGLSAPGNYYSPVALGYVDIGELVADIQTNNSSTCALTITSNVKCWGWGQNGTIGYGNTNNIGDNETPNSAGNVDLGVVPQMLFGGAYHNCVNMLNGKLKCWGFDGNGELGYGTGITIGDNETPSVVGRVKVSNEIAPTATFDSIFGTSSILLNSNQLSVLTPPHQTGIVDVTLTNYDTKFTTFQNSFSYLPSCLYSVSGTQDSACIDINITGGTLNITLPETSSFDSLSVSEQEETTSGLISPVTITDSRGTNAGWSATCKITNFSGNTNPNEILKLATSNLNGDSKFRLTPTALTTLNINSNSLDSVIDYISTQNTTSLTALDATGESNSFPIAAFPVGYGLGLYNKDLQLQLDVPPFVRAQPYNATMTCSVS